MDMLEFTRKRDECLSAYVINATKELILKLSSS